MKEQDWKTKRSYKRVVEAVLLLFIAFMWLALIFNNS